MYVIENYSRVRILCFGHFCKQIILILFLYFTLLLLVLEKSLTCPLEESCVAREKWKHSLSCQPIFSSRTSVAISQLSFVCLRGLSSNEFM